MFGLVWTKGKDSTTMDTAVSLIDNIDGAIRDDGSIAQKKRNLLMKEFWSLIKLRQEKKETEWTSRTG
jgi:hypothetical protein